MSLDLKNSPASTSLGYSFTEINAALSADSDALALHLFGNPQSRTRKVWKWKDGLELTRTGRHRGWYRDWRASRSYTPIGAAALALGMSYADAARWAALEYLRWPDPHGSTYTAAEKAALEQARAEAEAERRRRQSEADAAQEAENAAKIGEALALWRRGVPIKGTPAEIYLRSRGLEVESWPETLRWHPSKRQLLALSTSPEGDGTALQAIHLNDAGEPVRRADGSKIKLSHGKLTQGAVRFPGAADGPVVICEGVETALSVWFATGFTTWAGLGVISNVSVEALPHETVIIACPDDDPRGHPTIQAANKAVKRWKSEGRKVLIATPFEELRRDKSDHNDALRARGREYVAERFRQVLGEMAPAKPEASVEEAREDLAAAISSAMEKLTTEAIAVKIEGKDIETVSQIGIKVSVGGGKTQEAIAAMVQAISRMREEMQGGVPAVVYSVPTHRLGAELEQRILAEAEKQGVTLRVRTWRGREAIDPETGDTMCGNLEAVQRAQRAMLKPAETVCSSKRGQCPFFTGCRYQEQRRASADVWLVPHAALFHQRPEAVGQPALLIVDESIWQSAMRGFEAQKSIVGLGTLGRAPKVVLTESAAGVTVDPFTSAELHRIRLQLLAALQNSEKGYLRISTLLDAGITAELCRHAGAMEWKRVAAGGLRPGLDAITFNHRAETLAKEQGDIRQLATMWKLLAEAIDSGEETSGRVAFEVVKDTSGAEHEALVLRWTATITEGWQAPTLHIDATLRPSLVAHLFPRLEMAAEIDIATPHQRTVAVVGKSFSHLALSDEKAARKTWKAILHRATLTRGETLVVMPLTAEKIVRASEKVPPHVHILHHNATTGLDSFGQVGLLIVVGRTQPPPAVVSAMAGAITGKPVGAIGTADGWYQVSQVTVATADGSAMTLPRERHLPGLPEEIRASTCEDQLLQAIGRGRGVNRTAATPLEVEIWSNAEPPIPVDTFRLFEAPSKDEQAVAMGLWAEAAADLAALYSELGSENAIKTERKRLGSNSNSISNWNVTPTSAAPAEAEELTEFAQAILRAAPHLRAAVYRKAGQGARPRVAIWDPRSCPDPKGALEVAVGPVAVWAEFRWPARPEPPPPDPQRKPPRPIAETIDVSPQPLPPEPLRLPQGPGEAVLTSSQKVSGPFQRGVSRSMTALLSSASPAILNAGFKRAPPPAWLSGGRT